MKLPVLVAAEAAAWEAVLLSTADQRDCGVVVTRRCVDVVELLAMASAGQGRVALVSSSLRRLDADAIDRLLAVDVVPVAVVPRADVQTEQRMRALGVQHLVPDDAAAEVMVSVMQAAVVGEAGDPARIAPHGFSTAGAGSSTVGTGSNSVPPLPGDTSAIPETLSGRRGGVIAVWGPTGAPGRTTVAVNLADSFARLGSPTLLVDAEVYGATIATALGLLDESAGLAAACRQAAGQHLDANTLAGLCWQLSPTLRVLTGVPIAARWPELRPAGIEMVLSAARDLAEHTVVDCGFSLEADEEISFDTLAPRRNGATLTVLSHADVILAVGSADPVGMQRLVRGLTGLRDLPFAAPVWVVLNRVRPGVVPGDAARELAAALQRFAGCSPVALLPYDLESMDVALATGRLLAETRPHSPLRAELDELAVKFTGSPRRGRARSRRRA